MQAGGGGIFHLMRITSGLCPYVLELRENFPLELKHSLCDSIMDGLAM